MNYSGTYAVPRADLGEALIEYRRDDGGGWIGTKVLSPVNVTKRSANFSAYPRASILQNPDVKRAPRGKYNRIELEAKDHLYACQNFGIEILVDDSERALYSSDFDAEVGALMVAERAVKLAQEIRIANLLFSTTTFTGAQYTDHSADAPWTTTSTDIFKHVLDAKEASRRRTGMMPNTLVVSRPTWNLMKVNSGLTSKIKFPTALVGGVVTDQVLEESMEPIFGLKRVLIGDEVYNANPESPSGAVSESVTDVWSGSFALVCYVCNPQETIAAPAIGRTFVWTDYADGIDVLGYRLEERESDVIRVRHYVDDARVYDQAYGQLIKIK